jgi:hypothetical protein
MVPEKSEGSFEPDAPKAKRATNADRKYFIVECDGSSVMGPTRVC